MTVFLTLGVVQVRRDYRTTCRIARCHAIGHLRDSEGRHTAYVTVCDRPFRTVHARSGAPRDQESVFLGGRLPLNPIDPHAVLRIFDQLFPLYAFVEARQETEPETSAAEITAAGETLRLDSGRQIDGGRWITATSRVRTLDIFLRHREIQRRLKKQLLAEGADQVHLEVSIGDRLIDAIARRGDELWFYEVKTAATVRSCLREAIGQLLEYALWLGATRPQQLIVVGEPATDPLAEAYLDALNLSFPVPIRYRQLALS
jgi:hypothetical protein